MEIIVLLLKRILYVCRGLNIYFFSNLDIFLRIGETLQEGNDQKFSQGFHTIVPPSQGSLDPGGVYHFQVVRKAINSPHSFLILNSLMFVKFHLSLKNVKI